MNSDAILILEIWELVREALPPTKLQDVALGLLKAFEEYGFDHKTLAEAADEEPQIAKAYREGFDEGWEEDDNNSHDLDDQ